MRECIYPLMIACMDQVEQFDGKVATLENGRVIAVPAFIKEGDTIMVALVQLAQPNPCRTTSFLMLRDHASWY